MPTRKQKDVVCSRPVMAHVKDAKSPFPPTMAYMCAWAGTQPTYAVFTLCSSNIEVSETYFFDMVTTHNDHPSYVKHVSGSICVFFYPIWVLRGGGGGAPKGLVVHDLLLQFFARGSSKVQVLKPVF